MPAWSRPRWPVWIVTLMMLGTSAYQHHTYHVPPEYQTLFSVLYVVGCGALIAGTFLGARWAFVVVCLTVWIFPFETLISVKPPVRGTVLSLLHIASVLLLAMEWRYYWKRRDTPTKLPADSDH